MGEESEEWDEYIILPWSQLEISKMSASDPILYLPILPSAIGGYAMDSYSMKYYYAIIENQVEKNFH